MMAREPVACIPCWWKPCKWSSVSGRAGWCCDWLQGQRVTIKHNHTIKDSQPCKWVLCLAQEERGPRSARLTLVTQSHGGTGTRTELLILLDPHLIVPSDSSRFADSKTQTSQHPSLNSKCPTYIICRRRLSREFTSPFVLSWPLLSSAPSIACPSAAKRSLRVSISLRTGKKKVFKNVKYIFMFKCTHQFQNLHTEKMLYISVI